MKALLDGKVILVLPMASAIFMATYSTYCLCKRIKWCQRLGKELKAVTRTQFYYKIKAQCMVQTSVK